MTPISYHPAFEHQLVGKDRDNCGIGAERADILWVQQGECTEYVPAGVRLLRENSWIRTAVNPKKAYLSSGREWQVLSTESTKKTSPKKQTGGKGRGNEGE